MQVREGDDDELAPPIAVPERAANGATSDDMLERGKQRHDERWTRGRLQTFVSENVACCSCVALGGMTARDTYYRIEPLRSTSTSRWK